MLRLKYVLYLLQAWIIFVSFKLSYGLTKYDKKDLENLREEVRQMFQHAYDSYLNYAYPYDELRPLSCDGVDTWGSYSLTLIDALDTLAVMGNYTEFQRVVNIVTANANFDANINVSVFETNIRIIGGLLSAHMLSHRAGVSLVPGWPCNGPLLELAEDVARRLIAAFDTPTGMPYGTVNLQHGVPLGETTITCTAGVGTFILELGTLSRLTGDPLFEEVALTALDALHAHRSSLGLVGNHVDVATGRWTAQDAGIGAGVDSYYEYLAKGAILLQRPELMHMFDEGKAAIEKYLKRDDWHMWVSMSKGQVTLPVFQSLEAYWPGVLSLTGHISKGMKSLHNYHQVWKQYGFTPEFYYIPQGEVGTNRESYPLRPELIESVMYLYRATGDPYLIDVGKDILRSIQHSAKTPCGYATIKDVRDHRKEDRMESFFLAETTKYLYLLFDTDNFLHNHGQAGTVVKTPWGECLIDAGGYIFNTEAHPIDPGALHCCSGQRQTEIRGFLKVNSKTNNFKGIPLSIHQNRSKEHDQPPRTPWETKPAQAPNSLPLSKSATGHLDLISKERLAKYANTMVPLQDLLADTKETDISSESDTGDDTRGTDSESLVVELEAATDVVDIVNALDNDVSQLSAKECQTMETKEKESVNVYDAEPSVTESPHFGLESVSHGAQLPEPGGNKDSHRAPFGGRVEELVIRKEEDKIPPLNVMNYEDYMTKLENTAEHNVLDKAIRKNVAGSSGDVFLHPHETNQVVNNPRVIGNRIIGKRIMEPVLNSEMAAEAFADSESDRLGYRADDSEEERSDEDESDDMDDDVIDDTDDDEIDETDDLEPCGTDSSQTATEGEHFSDQVCDRGGGEKTEESIKEESSILFSKTKFDPQALFERLQAENRYKKDSIWVNDHEVMSCPVQPFLQRLSMSGEMFDVP